MAPVARMGSSQKVFRYIDSLARNSGSEGDKEREVTRRQWIQFVRKHRPNFNPTPRSVLCSANFKGARVTVDF